MNHMSKEMNTQEPQEEIYQSILGDDAPLEEETAAAPEESAPAKPKTSKKKLLTIAGVSAASVALVGCLTFAGIGIFNKNKTESIVTSANVKLDSKMVACYLHDMVSMYKQSYSEEDLLTYYQLDVNKSLKDQKYPYDETQTWFNVMMDSTKSTIEQQLIMYEAAKEAGFTMPEKEQQMIEEALADTDVASYGNGVTLDDIRKTLEIQALSSAYYYKRMEELEPSDEQIQEIYESDPKSFQTCGLAGFPVSYTADEEGEEAMSQEDAKKLADELGKVKTVKEFEKMAGEILIEHEGYTQEEVDANLPSIYNDAYTYTENNDLSEWAFGEAKVNDTLVLEGGGAYYVYIMTSEPSLDETSTVNVRHILFMEQEDNLAAAENALAEWESGEKTEESFAALAEKYTEDGGSANNGGLYEDVYPGQMVTNFNDWCFDESRQPGDTGIVETEYGVHVMYFSATGNPLWMSDIANTLTQQNYNEWYSGIAEKYPITFDEEAMNSIEG